MEYVAFDTDYLQQMLLTIRSNVGNIFSVALYLLVMVLGVYVVIRFVHNWGR